MNYDTALKAAKVGASITRPNAAENHAYLRWDNIAQCLCVFGPDKGLASIAGGAPLCRWTPTPEDFAADDWFVIGDKAVGPMNTGTITCLYCGRSSPGVAIPKEIPAVCLGCRHDLICAALGASVEGNDYADQAATFAIAVADAVLRKR